MTCFKILPAVAAAAALALSPSALGAAEQFDGKKIFLAQKCEMCHAVSSAEIKATGKIKAPDLTGLATKQDATLLSRYLRRDAEIGGKKHIKPFTGSDEEVGALIAWLQKQVPPAKK
ncbi:MAG TPA: c-type cytochrome [Vicinamibacteria bacterium]|nr:c-type cytochrome [Vicinamibacteria bacterium]